MRWNILCERPLPMLIVFIDAAINEAVNGIETETGLQDLRQSVFGAGQTGGSGAKSPASQQVPEHVPDLPVLLLTKQPLFPLFSRVIEVSLFNSLSVFIECVTLLERKHSQILN